MRLISILLISIGAVTWHAQAVELNSTIMLFNQDDLDKCEEQLQKAYSLKNTNIHLVSSIYVDLGDSKVEQFYLKDKQANAKKTNAANIKKYQKTLLQCVNIALNRFKDVYITVVINEIQDNRLWRNFYDYDPLRKYSGHSLYEITFSPFVKIEEKDRKRVYLSLTGEMGRSVKLYPQSYSKILELLPSELNVGISINFNQSFGSFFDFGLNLDVLNDFDFIGFSGYEMLPSNCSVDDFTENIKNFRKRIRDYGLTKPEDQWRIHINETGIGGGLPLAILISKLAFKGVYGAYSKNTDPWRYSSYRSIRKKFYDCLLGALEKTDLVEAAFIWNADSLDVQGLYKFSKEYRDNEIAQLIKEHNTKQGSP